MSDLYTISKDIEASNKRLQSLEKILENHAANTMILKQNPLKNRPMMLGALFCLLLEYGFLSAPFSQGMIDSVPIALFVVIIPAILIHIGLLFLPGQGDLILTPDGFEVSVYLYALQKKYRWADVINFSVSPIWIGKGFQRKLCFDVIRNGKKVKKDYLRFCYDLSLEEMLALLTDWKTKSESIPVMDHSPEVVEVSPRTVSWKGSLPLQVMLSILIIVSIWLSCTLLGGKRIWIENRTPVAIHNIQIRRYHHLPKGSQWFTIPSLKAGEAANIVFPQFNLDGTGTLRVSYEEDNKTSCAYLSHTVCDWRSGEDLFLEPHGKIVSKSPYCKPFKAVDQFKSEPCTGKDALIAKEGFQVGPPILVSVIPAFPEDKPALAHTEKDYIQQLQADVRRSWHPPVADRVWHAVVKFKVLRDGTVKKAVITRSSGNAAWDKVCLDAVQNASPLPPVPVFIKPVPVPVEFSFDYHIPKEK